MAKLFTNLHRHLLQHFSDTRLTSELTNKQNCKHNLSGRGNYTEFISEAGDPNQFVSLNKTLLPLWRSNLLETDLTDEPPNKPPSQWIHHIIQNIIPVLLWWSQRLQYRTCLSYFWQASQWWYYTINDLWYRYWHQVAVKLSRLQWALQVTFCWS